MHQCSVLQCSSRHTTLHATTLCPELRVPLRAVMFAAVDCVQTPDLWCRGADRQTIAMALQGLTTGIDAGKHCYRQWFAQQYPFAHNLLDACPHDVPDSTHTKVLTSACIAFVQSSGWPACTPWPRQPCKRLLKGMCSA